MKFLKILGFSVLSILVQSCLSADEDPVKLAPISGKNLSPNIGGAAQPNQVWVHLSSGEMTTNKRTDWDLAFYTGAQFRVLINSSIISAVGKIPNATDIDKITTKDVEALQNQIQIGTFDPSNLQYVDNPNGDFLHQTSGIAEIKDTDAENSIYLLNMGRDIYGGTITTGSVMTGGEHRGWMKIQIFKTATAYKIKYAKLEENSHQEYIVGKDSDYNFKFLNLNQKREVIIHPKKKKWDLGFTVFTNEVNTNEGQTAGSYVFADFVVSNLVDGVGAYQVNVASGQTLDAAYNAFKMKDIDTSKFIFNDQRAVGDKWRSTTGSNGAQVYSNRFFIIKSADGFFFKLRFNRMTNDKGERGHTTFEYEPL
ncbi:HmuY family protein [Soonwooa sp.]|uniref:HmuY family protein n=1 Tax=Soonwooa sp. TaxID=1938592 RepID=UPI0028A5E20A|nr:HmuY family protein [Soonwooa sp.]